MIKKKVERTGKGERKVLKTRLRPLDYAAASLRGLGGQPNGHSRQVMTSSPIPFNTAWSWLSIALLCSLKGDLLHNFSYYYVTF
jgi:hypothetical protein